MAANPKKSKKQSVANSKSELPEKVELFLDRSIGKKKVAQALRQAGATVHVHDDYFPSDAPDEDWLREVGKRKWVVFTKDRNLRYRVVKRKALLRAGVAAFVLTAGNIDGSAMANAFVKALPKIGRFLQKTPPPFIASITRSGEISLLFRGGDKD